MRRFAAKGTKKWDVGWGERHADENKLIENKTGAVGVGGGLLLEQVDSMGLVHLRVDHWKSSHTPIPGSLGPTHSHQVRDFVFWSHLFIHSTEFH